MEAIDLGTISEPVEFKIKCDAKEAFYDWRKEIVFSGLLAISKLDIQKAFFIMSGWNVSYVINAIACFKIRKESISKRIKTGNQKPEMPNENIMNHPTMWEPRHWLWFLMSFNTEVDLES